jgi:hypothetical protein
MPEVTERLRLLSLLAAIGELSASKGDPEDGVELLDRETSMRWILKEKPRPFASMASLQYNGYQGTEAEQLERDFRTLVERGYVALTLMHDGYGLTERGLAVYRGQAEFA